MFHILWSRDRLIFRCGFRVLAFTYLQFQLMYIDHVSHPLQQHDEVLGTSSPFFYILCLSSHLLTSTIEADLFVCSQ